MAKMTYNYHWHANALFFYYLNYAFSAAHLKMAGDLWDLKDFLSTAAACYT